MKTQPKTKSDCETYPIKNFKKIERRHGFKVEIGQMYNLNNGKPRLADCVSVCVWLVYESKHPLLPINNGDCETESFGGKAWKGESAKKEHWKKQNREMEGCRSATDRQKTVKTRGRYNWKKDEV